MGPQLIDAKYWTIEQENRFYARDTFFKDRKFV